MTDFKIKRGLSSVMFTASGKINPRLIIEEGVWYLCTDTAELYLGIKTDEGTDTLKKINGNSSGQAPSDADIADIKAIVEALSERVAVFEDIELFKKVASEEDLPMDFSSDAFNPNVTYYIHDSKTNEVATYIYDRDIPGYLCTSSKQPVGLGIESTEINSSGDLVIKYTDGSSKVVGHVVGADGATVALKIGDQLFTQTNGIIALPEFATLEYVNNKFAELVIPKAITKLSELENDVGFLTEHQDLSDYAKKADVPSIDGLASETFVKNAITNAQLGQDVDTSNFVTVDVLDEYATKSFVEEELASSLESLLIYGGDATPDN